MRFGLRSPTTSTGARLAWITPVMRARRALMALIGRLSRDAANEGG
jgi:hypothetical protein